MSVSVPNHDNTAQSVLGKVFMGVNDWKNLKILQLSLPSLCVQKYNMTLPTSTGKYTRIFDTQLQMGQPYQLKIQSSEWLLPKDGSTSAKFEVIEAMETNQVFQLTSDKTILYFNDGADLRELNTSAVLWLQATASLKVEEIRF